jgi:uncharacterized repeat protein (TIGR04138 family)
MDNSELVERVEDVARTDGRYRREAFFFVFEALQYTVNSTGRTGKPRHVTGQELVHGISDYALDQYGPMTRTVFEHWGVNATRDFGEIVFTLVGAGLMGKTEEDNIEDFIDVYDFDSVFDWRKAIGRRFKNDDE